MKAQCMIELKLNQKINLLFKKINNLIKFFKKKMNEDIYRYTSIRSKEKLKVNIGSFTCECSMFLDKAYCVHLVKLADLLDLDLEFFTVKIFF